MKFIVPIQNLVIDEISKLGDVVLIPPLRDTNLVFEESVFNTIEMAEITKILGICNEDYMNTYCNYTTALFEYPFSDEEYHHNKPIQDFDFLDKLCYTVDRALDYLRLLYCQIGKMDTLPGIPGILDGYRFGLVINLSENTYRHILGNVYNIYVAPGIGLYSDPITINDINSSFYNQIFNKRTDEIYNNCRVALARINEAMYMNNINTSFIYLMSTLEMLASNDYLQFKKVKTSIISFVANNKVEYHEMCGKLRDISENIRTEIVHNGKNLYDLFASSDQVKSLLWYLTGVIVNYCESVINTGITNFTELEIEKERRIHLFS